ncbi:cytochrome P450 [Phaeosphaeria sp. MPI-PUGE-AT-0046c]|nr:cytochrome P450 [Phaeosphaeria sp. MPI-PUGE-AT-0046c]
MDLKAYQYAIASLVILTVYRLYQYSKLSTRPAKFPPGPKTAPFIGNVHQMPTTVPHVKFGEFARQFGAITGLKVGCQNWIILNTWQAVHDLIDKKSTIYSSRPSIPGVEIVAPNGISPVMTVYGDLWRSQRKKLVECLGGERTDRMKPVQDAESTQMIYDILTQPGHLEEHVERSFGSAILVAVFGTREKTIEPTSWVQTFFDIEERWSRVVEPTLAPPYGGFPFLKKLPLWMTPWGWWKKLALEVKRDQSNLYYGLFEETKERLRQGKSGDCFMAQCLRLQEKEGVDDEYLAYLGGVLLEGGAETSSSTTMVFIMALAAFPEVLARAQEEIDLVCGHNRVPDRDDMGKLPYLRACMLEVLRWRPIVPLGVPHQTTKADEYEGFAIPDDTTVIINAYGINHDETFYDSPSIFDPTRYLDNEFGSTFAARNYDAVKGRRVNYSFGAGRRVCPGQRFAENSLMMHFAKLVWAFDFVATGMLPVDTWDGWSEGLAFRPKDLKVEFKLRAEGKRKCIERAWAEADQFLSQFE